MTLKTWHKVVIGGLALGTIAFLTRNKWLPKKDSAPDGTKAQGTSSDGSNVSVETPLDTQPVTKPLLSNTKPVSKVAPATTLSIKPVQIKPMSITPTPVKDAVQSKFTGGGVEVDLSNRYSTFADSAVGIELSNR